MTARLPFDVILAAFSGGVLIYSAFLLVPTAQVYLTDIAYEPLRRLRGGTGFEAIGGLGVFPRFPNDDLPRAVEQYINTGVGLELLIAGTFGGVIATVITGRPFADERWVERLVVAAAAFLAGLWGSRAYHVTQRHERSRRASWYSFLVWLKYFAFTKPHENLRVVAGKTATDSGFTLLMDCIKQNSARSKDALWEAVLGEVLRHARQRLVRRDDEGLSQWADEIAASPRLRP